MSIVHRNGDKKRVDVDRDIMSGVNGHGYGNGGDTFVMREEMMLVTDHKISELRQNFMIFGTMHSMMTDSETLEWVIGRSEPPKFHFRPGAIDEVVVRRLYYRPFHDWLLFSTYVGECPFCPIEKGDHCTCRIDREVAKGLDSNRKLVEVTRMMSQVHTGDPDGFHIRLMNCGILHCPICREKTETLCR